MPKSSTKPKFKHDKTTLRGLIVFCSALGILLSLFSFAVGHDSQNLLGWTGYALGRLFHGLFGIGSYFLCLYIGWCGWRLLFSKPINHPSIKTLYIIVFVISICILLSLIEDRAPNFAFGLGKLFYTNYAKHRYHLGGALFYYLYRDIPVVNLHEVFNTTGILLVFSTTLLGSFFFLTKVTPAQCLSWFVARWKKDPVVADAVVIDDANQVEEIEATSRFVKLKTSHSVEPISQKGPTVQGHQELLEIQPETNLTVRPSLSQKEQQDRRRIEKPQSIPNSKEPIPRKRQTKETQGNYKLPSTSLLTHSKKVDNSLLKQDLRRQAEVLEETLLSFGIEAKVGQINCGPTINSFEVHPAIGVKVQKIKTLENDIALNMEAKSIRIIAPIPGKAAVGIEVPNPQPQEVSFKDMLVAYQQGSRKMHVPILLGKSVSGEYVMNDLTKMPHCIIAGATGSGKSVCINTIVMSILMNATPDQIRLIMIDPKKVELTPYMKLPHMLAPVITEPQGACAALNWLVKEMESRYEILKQLGVRNIDAFNTRTINEELEASLDREIPKHLPYIVVIIDELADLMMVASNDIETPIARIAQMARAVGIHMILATQRPSREVITGLIKANFPTRIAFKVASRVNSQIILDEVGAESLLGNGDMLFLPPGTSTLVRAQGAFIRDEDILAVVKQICDQAPPNYVIASFDAMGREEAEQEKVESAGNSDSLYEQAVKIVLSSGNASTTFLQRKLKIGYARAASLMDQMEASGVLGAADGNKQRKILMAHKSDELETDEKQED